MLDGLLNLLPAELASRIRALPASVLDGLEEIRVRQDRPLEVGHAGGFAFVTAAGALSADPAEGWRPTAELCARLLERITNHSLYAMEEELRRGYVTVSGGHRIGLAGRTVLEGGAVRGLRDIGAFNIRIARDIRGAARRLLPHIADRARRSLLSTLIVAPPQQGKTTMLRDIIRAVSYGDWPMPEARGWPARKVGVVDERSEIAACVRGVPVFDVGPRTDVLDACPKAEGMMMLLRSMSPELLAADEIGRPEDADAIREAAHAGVPVIATAHASDLEDARGRTTIRRLVDEGVFKAVVELRRRGAEVSFRVVRPIPAAREPTRRAEGAGAC